VPARGLGQHLRGAVRRFGLRTRYRSQGTGGQRLPWTASKALGQHRLAWIGGTNFNIGLPPTYFPGAGCLSLARFHLFWTAVGLTVAGLVTATAGGALLSAEC
jgi:hypothetical protein